MSGLSENDFSKIIELCKLDEIEEELFKQYMRKTKVQKLMIRQVLCDEGKKCRQAFYLLEGMVNLTICLANSDRVILSQVGKGQLLNLELILNDWKSKYTIVVSSSYIRYILLEERQINLLTAHIREDIEANYCFREREIGNKNKKIVEEERRKKMRQTISKMSLPNINLQSLKKQEIITQISEKIMQNKGQYPSEILVNKIRSSKMSKQLSCGSQPRYQLNGNRNQSIQNKQKEGLQISSEELIPHPQNKNRLAEFKLQRLKSERSVSLHDHKAKQAESNRNERLFKSQLKQIVKRKLLFERKHFQILRKFANKNSKPMIKKPFHKNQEQNGPLDNYFNL